MAHLDTSIRNPLAFVAVSTLAALGAAVVLGACSSAAGGGDGATSADGGAPAEDGAVVQPDDASTDAAAPQDGAPALDGAASYDGSLGDGAADGAADAPPYGGEVGPPNPNGELHFFVTDTRITADLMAEGHAANGFAGADNVCAAEVKRGAYGYGTWRAFVSGVFNGATINAPDRIAAAGPWYALRYDFPRYTGPLAWANKAELAVADQPARDPIGHLITAGAWTATKLGVYAAPACEGPTGNSWESADVNVRGGYGSAGHALDAWSFAGTYPCNFSLFLYCFEQ